MNLYRKNDDKSIPAKEMQEGQIGVITSWSATSVEGRIVTRYKSDLITLGNRDSHWPGWFNAGYDQHKCRVEILPVGTLLEV